MPSLVSCWFMITPRLSPHGSGAPKLSRGVNQSRFDISIGSTCGREESSCLSWAEPRTQHSIATSFHDDRRLPHSNCRRKSLNDGRSRGEAMLKIEGRQLN